MKYVLRKKLAVVCAFLFDALGYFIFRFFRKRSGPLDGNQKNILVIRLDHLGDVLLATAAPKIIKENFQKSRVIFLTSSWSAPLLENNPFVDEVVLYDAPWFYKKRYKKNPSSPGFFGLASILRKKKIDLAIGLRGDFRENLLMFLSGIKKRLGYGITGGNFFLTHEVAYRQGVHESAHLVDLLSVLGVSGTTLEPKLYFSDTETARFDQRLERLGILKDEKYISFLIGAGSPSKEWPVENVDLFLEQFLKRFSQHKAVVVGSNLKLAEKIHQKNNPQLLNLVGETSLHELCLLIRRSTLFIGPDSGPTHIAVALGVPAVFLYSGTNDYERWRPLAEASTILRHPVSCSPCYLETCNVKGHPCMSEIKPEEVIKTVETVLY